MVPAVRVEWAVTKAVPVGRVVLKAARVEWVVTRAVPVGRVEWAATREVPVVRAARCMVRAVPKVVRRMVRGLSDLKAHLIYVNRYPVPCRRAVHKRTASSPANGESPIS